MRRLAFFVLVPVIASASVVAAPTAARAAAASPTRDRAMRRLEADASGKVTIESRPDGRPSFVTASVPISKFSNSHKLGDAAKDFFRAYGALFGITDPDNQLSLHSSVSDSLGMTHVKFDQRYKGLSVIGRQVIVHFRGDHVTAVNGDLIPGIGVPTAASVSAGTAQAKARAHLAERHPTNVKKAANLVVFVDAAERPHLAWRVTTATVAPLGLWRTFVDARSGKIAGEYNDIHQAKNRQIFDSDSNPNCDSGAGSPDCTLPDPATAVPLRTEGGGAVGGDGEADNAYTNTGLAYDYFNTTFSRDSYDGAGHTINSTVHFGSTLFDDAFWCPDDCAAYYGVPANGAQLVFGNTDGTTVTSLAGDPDVVTHEFTHAVSGSTAGFMYIGQTAALDESYADMFAALRVDDWTIGELSAPTFARHLDNPANDTPPDPGNMSGFVKTAEDSGGAHQNSTIPSHAGYLIAKDGTYGVGVAHTAQIYYRALTKYLTSTSDFEDNLYSLDQAAVDIYGAGSPEEKAVDAGMAAVGILGRPLVLAPVASALFKGGSAHTVAWIAGAALGQQFDVQYGIPSGSSTVTQGFETTTLPSGFVGGGDVGWSTTTQTASGGLRSARSGAISDNQRSTLSTTRTLMGPGLVSFNVQVSTDQVGDPWSFYVDDQLYDAFAGALPWTSVSYPVPAGTHTFTWIYERDASGSGGSDEAWIDDLSFTNSPSVSWTAIGGTTAVDASTQPWTTPTVSSASYRVRVLTHGAANGLGEGFSAPFTVDATAPVPSMTGSALNLKVQTSRTVALSWTASDPLSGVVWYNVRERHQWVSGSAFSSFTYDAYHTVGTSRTITFPTTARGYTICFSVQALDGVGNLSGFSKERCTALPFDDRQFPLNHGWVRGSSSAFYESTYTSSTTLNSVLGITGVRFKTLIFIAETCSTCGIVGIYRGNTLLKKISLYATSTHTKVEFTVVTYTTLAASSTITIKVLTSGKHIYFDGLGFNTVT